MSTIDTKLLESKLNSIYLEFKEFFDNNHPFYNDGRGSKPQDYLISSLGYEKNFIGLDPTEKLPEHIKQIIKEAIRESTID